MDMLIYSMLHPQTGQQVMEWWDSPYKKSCTKFMSKGCFKQISSMLHFRDNENIDGMNRDSLHKIQPLLTILKPTLSWYATFGTEFSFDEATMACHSSYRWHLIVYNSMRPAGKFHFKISMLCCTITNLVQKIKVHTHSNCDTEILESEDMVEQKMNKSDTLTVEMCWPLYHTWATVNMDNYYMSETCAMHLWDNGVYCRGTIRTSRKLIPKSILFTLAEVKSLPRGTHWNVVNTDYGWVAVGWIDNG